MKALSVILYIGACTALTQDEIIRTVNNSPTTWTAGINFNGVHPGTMSHLAGVVHMPDHLRSPGGYIPPDIQNDLPASFDARTQWPGCPTIGHIRDQSNCGSCWAFGAVEAMSDRVCIHSNGTEHAVLSARDLMTCDHGPLKLAFGCNGGDPQFAWRYYKYHGIVTGGDYNTTGTCQPYQFPPCAHYVNDTDLPACAGNRETPPCVKACLPGYGRGFEQDKHYGAHHHVITSGNCEHIQREIYQNGPVEAEFMVYEDFLTYKSGVYQHVTGAAVGYHAVKILGWGEAAEGGTPFWLCANSWNASWGDRGFFRILRGVNECDIESEINCGNPRLDNDTRRVAAASSGTV